MLEPPIDPTTSTDAELVDAYIAEGMTIASAQAYVAALRMASQEFPVD